MDLITALRVHGIQYQQDGGKRNEIRINCPWCHEQRFRLNINLKKNAAICWNCDFKTRNIIRQLSKVLPGLGDVRMAEGAEHDLSVKPEPVRLPEDYEILTEIDRSFDLAQKAYDYLVHRQISDREIRRYRIGVSFMGRYAYRIIFPVWSPGKRTGNVIQARKLVGIVGRDFTGRQEPKYLNSRGVKAIWNAPRSPLDDFILAEGIIKGLAIERALGIESGALLGHSISDAQIDMLTPARRVFLWPDPDQVGAQGFLDVAGKLQAAGKSVWLPWPMPHLQADDDEPEGLCAKFAAAMPYSEDLDRKYRLAIERRRWE